MKLITQSGHFWLEFDNGYTLSVFNGYASHTENYNAEDKYFDFIKNKKIWEAWSSADVEIGITKNGTLVTDKIIDCEDTVKTVDLKELIEIINLLNNLEE